MHNCWSITCKCGTLNQGCVCVGVRCKNCSEPIDFTEYYRVWNQKSKHIYISPEALRTIQIWDMEPEYCI